MTTRTRILVTYLYPGSFFPERSGSVEVPDAEPETVLAHAPTEAPDEAYRHTSAPRWFGAEVSIAEWERYTSDSGKETWLRTSALASVHRIYVGEVLTLDEVIAENDEFGGMTVLIANMETNGWDRIVQTHHGNTQPLREGDVVLSEAEVAA